MSTDRAAGDLLTEMEALLVPDFWRRLEAFLLDTLVLLVPCLLEFFLILEWMKANQSLGSDFLSGILWLPPLFGPLSARFLVIYLLWTTFALMIPYMFLLEALTRGRSLGKIALGLRVVSRDGSRPTVIQTLVRNVIRFIDMLPHFYLLGVIAFSGDRLRRRIGDRVAGTLVVIDGERVGQKPESGEQQGCA